MQPGAVMADSMYIVHDKGSYSLRRDNIMYCTSGSDRLGRNRLTVTMKSGTTMNFVFSSEHEDFFVKAKEFLGSLIVSI